VFIVCVEIGMAIVTSPRTATGARLGSGSLREQRAAGTAYSEEAGTARFVGCCVEPTLRLSLAGMTASFWYLFEARAFWGCIELGRCAHEMPRPEVDIDHGMGGQKPLCLTPDLNLSICRSRRRVGRCEFSARSSDVRVVRAELARPRNTRLWQSVR
jgi:hypothetical protein